MSEAAAGGGGGGLTQRKGRKVVGGAEGGAEGGAAAEDEGEDGKQDDSTKGRPRLTMMEEVLLLGLKDREGYTSFWNDSISYGLRGCILAELALRGRIRTLKEKFRRRLEEKKLELISQERTGDRILDEVIDIMAADPKCHSIEYWVDVLSGETWNVMKLKYSLKNLRERLAKGLVDKGVLRTEMKSFVLFEMATHPVADPVIKEDIMYKVQDTLLRGSTADPRKVVLVCMAYGCNVIDNALNKLPDHQREMAETRLQEFMNTWPQAAAERDPQNEVLCAIVAFFAQKDNSFFGL